MEIVKDINDVSADQFLGTGHNGEYLYYLAPDNYVYQFDKHGKFYGWLCSAPAWERTLHKILDN